MPGNVEPTELIRQKALDLGFSACGFSQAGLMETEAARFRSWLDNGSAGEMEYLRRNVDLRSDPRRLVPDAKTVISLLARYSSGNKPASDKKLKMSRYAKGGDYHKILKSKGLELLKWINGNFGPVSGRFFCDSAPVMERSWAIKAGLGWIGKNGCLIVPGRGSWFFIAELIVDLALEEKIQLVEDQCGSCRRCIDACPTGAIKGDGTVHAADCIAYLTIEHRSEIPAKFSGKMNGWFFGCDICQEACPWNRYPEQLRIPGLLPDSAQESLYPEEIIKMEENEFDRIFTGTALRRTGLELVRRNIIFAGLEPGGK